MEPCLLRLFSSSRIPVFAGLLDIAQALQALFDELGFVGSVFGGGCGFFAVVYVFVLHGWKTRENFLEHTPVHISRDWKTEQMQNRRRDINQIWTETIRREIQSRALHHQNAIVPMAAFV